MPAGLPVTGVILSDHVRSIDWRTRRAERVGHADDDTLSEVCGKLTALFAD
ncbi:MAG: type II toxin-antitoxin system PemK/MazF family toxin [Verrucomicrobiota bacterium]